MFDKYLFFTDRQQGFYETQEQIALNCCVSVITVKRAVKLFKNAGVITVKKTKAAAWMNNIYFVKDIALCDSWQLLKSEALIQYEKEQSQIKQERQQVKDNKKEEWETLHNEFCNSSKQPLQANRSDSKQLPEINNTSALPDIPDAYKQPYKEPVNDFIINDDYLYNNDDDPFHVGFYASMNSKQESIPTFENDYRYDPNCPF